MAYDLRATFKLEDDFSLQAQRANKQFKKMIKTVDKLNDTFKRLNPTIATTAELVEKIGDNLNEPIRKANKLAKAFKKVAKQAGKAAVVSEAVDVPNTKKSPVQVESPALSLPNLQMPSIIKLPIIITGVAGAIAALAPLSAAILGLTASLTTAGIGAVAFGAVAVSSLTKIFEAAEDVEKIQEKIDNATTAKQLIKAQTELNNLYADMNNEQMIALKTLQRFKSFWEGFSEQFDSQVFKAFSYGVEILQKVLTKLEPTINSVGATVVAMMGRFNRSLNSSGAQEFFTWLSTNAADSLKNFSIIAMNTLNGVIGILKAFTPTGKEAEKSLIGMTESFSKWANSLENSQGFQKFIEYAKQNAPILKQTLSSLFLFIKNSIVALAPVGTKVLQMIGKIFETINNNFTAFKIIAGGVLASIMAFGAIVTVVSIIKAVLFSFNALKTGIMFVRKAFTVVRIAMLAFPGNWIILAIGAVILAAQWLYQNWDLVKEKTMQLIDKLREMPDWLKGLLGPIGMVIDAAIDLADNWDSTKSVWANVWSFMQRTAADAVNGIIGKINSMIETINKIPGVEMGKVKEVKWGSPKTKSPRMGTPTGMDGSHATGLARVPFDGYAAELHANESVLTAKQSSLLRSLGVLKNNGSKPVIDTNALRNKSRGYQKTGASKQSSQTNKVTITGGIHISGAQKTTKEMARDLVKEINHVVSLGAV